MTTLFIYISFAVIVIYDLIMLYINRNKENPKWKFITTIFRKWYREKPIVPYMVGVVFIGHFQTLIELKSIPVFLTITISYMVYCLIMAGTDIVKTRKFYELNQKIFLIPLIFGTIAGIFWRG